MRTLEPATAQLVEVERSGIEAVDRLAAEWRELCGRSESDEPFYRPEWIAAYLRAFVPGGKLLLLTARLEERLTGVLPLLEESKLFYGIPVKMLRAPANMHSCRFDLVRAAGSDGTGAGVVPLGGEQFDPTRADRSMSGVCRRILARQDFASIVQRRHRNYSILASRLRDLSPPLFDDLEPGVCPLFFPIRTDRKMALLQRLSESGVEGMNFWSTVPRALAEGAFPEVDALRRTIVEIPCHQGLSEQDVESLAVVVRAAWNHVHDVHQGRRPVAGMRRPAIPA